MKAHISAWGGASVAVLAFAGLATPALAAPEKEKVTAWEASRIVNDDATIRTGVAKARDPLDSATSTSVIKDVEIERLKSPSLAELFRNIPGIRVEAGGGETGNSYTVRGLPLVGQGAKYISMQEDGLPVMEYGDFSSIIIDTFIRADHNIAQVESIRGGSASTFASDAPGGVINLISKTGEAEGGSVQVSSGLDYDSNRVDVDYGGHLGDGWRFHAGGFYRQGEGPRAAGYEAMRGGQIKANVTREFSGGYVRFNVKVLDDKVPYYYNGPIAISGTNDSPVFANVPGFDIRSDTSYSRNISSYYTPLGQDNLQNEYRIKSTALGAEAQVALAGWTITERFRYTSQSVDGNQSVPIVYFRSSNAASALTRGAGGTLTYASGPNVGQPVDPNGVVSLTILAKTKAQDLGFVVNDLRASRAWSVGGGSLTTTAGLYFASQKQVMEQYYITAIQDAAAGGNSALVNLNLPAGLGGGALTDNGVFLYSSPSGSSHKQFNVTYAKLAPYASANFQTGKLAVGGSIRYDYDKTTGTAAQSSTTFVTRDVNGNGSISAPEMAVQQIVPGDIRPINIRHGYVSYSVSANYRVAEPFSLFLRYSLGGRGASEPILFSGALDSAGNLIDKSAGHDSVRQLEGGFKFRSNGIFVNLTGFLAKTRELALQVRSVNGETVYSAVSRGYRTYGAELEGGIRRGPFSVNGSVTLTGGEITAAEDATLIGKKPRHQATFVYRISPQFDIEKVTLGANILGQTESYTQDINQLKMPGYATVGLFAQVRPVERLVLGVNASNVFNQRAYVDVFDGSVPAPQVGVGTGRALYGRLVTASARFYF